MGSKKPQIEKVLNHLRKHKKGITSMEAFWKYRITRLSAKIFELREKGYRIHTIMEDNILSDGQHGRYVLLGEPEEYPY